jgi:hypothetical protein
MLHTRLAPGNCGRRTLVSGVLSTRIYELAGDGIWVAYFPDGIGSVPSADASRLLYRDVHGTRTFGSDEIQQTFAPGFGTVITVVLARSGDTDETFSLVLPPIRPARAIGLCVPLRAIALKTLQGEPHRQQYTVTTLNGELST